MTTSLFHTNNYTLGRGAVFFEPFTAGTTTPAGGERFFGDVNACDFAFKTTDIDHYASTAGIKEIDLSLVTEVTRTGSLTTEDISVANLAMFFLGTSTPVTVVGATIAAEGIVGVLADRYYQLGETVANPAGNRGITGVPTVKIGATSLVAGVDYVIDPDGASLYVVPGGLGDVPGTPPTLSVGYVTSSETYQTITSGNNQIAGKLRFRSANPAGQNRDAVAPYVVLSPNGSYSLIGDKLTALQFNMKVLRKGGTGGEALYIDGRAAGS